MYRVVNATQGFICNKSLTDINVSLTKGLVTKIFLERYLQFPVKRFLLTL